MEKECKIMAQKTRKKSEYLHVPLADCGGEKLSNGFVLSAPLKLRGRRIEADTEGCRIDLLGKVLSMGDELTAKALQGWLANGKQVPPVLVPIGEKVSIPLFDEVDATAILITGQIKPLDFAGEAEMSPAQKQEFILKQATVRAVRAKKAEIRAKARLELADALMQASVELVSDSIESIPEK